MRERVRKAICIKRYSGCCFKDACSQKGDLTLIFVALPPFYAITKAITKVQYSGMGV